MRSQGKNLSKNFSMKNWSTSYSSLPSIKCKLCGKIAFSPIVCPECKQVICRTCSYKTGSSTCILCNNRIGLRNEPEKISEGNIIGIKKKNCKYLREGCQFLIFIHSKHDIGKINMLAEHEKICRYKPMICPNKGCTNPNILAKDLNIHSINCNASKKECYGCKKEFTTVDYRRHLSNLLGDENGTTSKILQRSIKNLTQKANGSQVCSYCNVKKPLMKLKKCFQCNDFVCQSCYLECGLCEKYLCLKCRKYCPHLSVVKLPLINSTKFLSYSLIPFTTSDALSKLQGNILMNTTEKIPSSFKKYLSSNMNSHNLDNAESLANFKQEKNIKGMLFFIKNREKMKTSYTKQLLILQLKTI